MSLIELKNVSFAYDKLPVVRDLSLEIEANSFWTVIGPNGSGKSTFLRLLANMMRPQTGSIFLNHQLVTSYSPASLAKQVALVSQESAPVFGFSVFETVLMGRFFRQKGVLFESGHDREAVRDALEATDTAGLADRPLSQLSGGERQRVFIARALAQETPVLLLDEPTSHLDLKHQLRVLDLLKHMQLKNSKTIVLVSHDLNLAGRYADRMLLLTPGGGGAWGQPGEILSPASIETAFGVQGRRITVENENYFIPRAVFNGTRADGT
jgi:iron complex transport system ATP-binding protein